MPRRWIKVYSEPPPGESMAIGDLDDRPAIADGDVPTAEWNVEREDGTPARMTGQQILDQAGVGDGGATGQGAVVETFEVLDAQQGIPTTVYQQYRNSRTPRQEFRAEWFAGVAGVNSRIAMLDERPINVSFDPPVPAQDQLKRIVAITFTPVVRGLHIADFYLE